MSKNWIAWGIMMFLILPAGCGRIKEKVKERVPPGEDVIKTLARAEVEKRENAEGFELTPPLPRGPLQDFRSCVNLKVEKVEMVELGNFVEKEKLWPIKVKVSGTCEEGMRVLGRVKSNPKKRHQFSGEFSLQIGKNPSGEWVVK